MRAALLCASLWSCAFAARAQVVDEAESSPAARQGDALDPRALERALAELSVEPAVERVLDAALRAAPHTGAQAALASRARDAGWVPRVGLRARRGQAVDLRSSDPGEPLRLSTDDDLTLEASLTFELDRVVFRREEVTLDRERRAELEQRRRRAREVVTLYFERRRLQLEQRLLGVTLERWARIAEIEAELDLFTNGAFKRMIMKRAWRTDGGTPAIRPRLSPRSSSTTTP